MKLRDSGPNSNKFRLRRNCFFSLNITNIRRSDNPVISLTYDAILLPKYVSTKCTVLLNVKTRITVTEYMRTKSFTTHNTHTHTYTHTHTPQIRLIAFCFRIVVTAVFHGLPVANESVDHARGGSIVISHGHVDHRDVHVHGFGCVHDRVFRRS